MHYYSLTRILLASAVLAISLAPVHAAVEGRVYAGSRPLADAVVWLDAPPGHRRPVHRHALMDQRNLTFLPHVLAVEVGTIVDFPNHDRVLHNVFSFHDGKTFNLGLYPVGAVKPVHFDRPGLSRIYCNIHPNMAAYVMAVDTPYFAVSDSHGNYRIPDAPAGAHTFHAWKPGGPEIRGTLTTNSGETTTIRFPG